MTAAETLARAKVNLFLHVRGQRPDGYHLLESLVVFPRVGDRLEMEPASGLSLTLSGPFADQLSAGPDNLVLKAAEALAGGAPGRGAALRLTKALPVASGIGGGSADAAAALRLLAAAWDLEEAPARIAPQLGADVPMCLPQRPALVSGVGETLAPAPAGPAFWMVLVNPMQPLSTPEVFSALERKAHPAGPPPPAIFTDFSHLTAWLSRQRNDLEEPARRLRPAIGRVLSAIRWDGACALARMSGSGATCFGLYAEEAAALAAADRLRAAEPGWWVAAAPVESWG